METLREIFIKLGLSVAGADFAEALALEHALEKGADMVVEAVEKIGDFFVEAVEKTAHFGEQMDLLSIKTGASAEEIQKLGYAAMLNGSSAEAMGTAIQRLARQMEEAKDGSVESQKHFTKLGISMDQIRHSSPDEMMKIIADKLKAMGDAGKASASAMQLLGRSGKDLVPTLLLGREGLEEMGQELEDLGGLMSTEAIKSAREFEDSLKELHAVGDGLVHLIGSTLIEALQPMLKAFLDWYKVNQKLIAQRVQTFAHAVGEALKFVWNVAMGLGKALMFLLDNLKLVAIVLGSTLMAVLIAFGPEIAFVTSWMVALGVQSVASALAAGAAWLIAAAPMILLGAALVIAALAAEDFYVFLKDGDSVMGHLGPKWVAFYESLLAAKGDDPWWLTAIKDFLKALEDIEGFMDKFQGRAGATREKLANDTEHDTGAVDAWISRSLKDLFNQAGETATPYSPYAAGPNQSFGGGASPDASAKNHSTPFGPNQSFSVSNTFVQGPGQSAGALADEATSSMENWHKTKLREAAALMSHP